MAVINVEYACMPPFLHLTFRCDICAAVYSGAVGYQRPIGGDAQGVIPEEVALWDGRTICKPCLWRIAIQFG